MWALIARFATKLEDADNIIFHEKLELNLVK